MASLTSMSQDNTRGSSSNEVRYGYALQQQQQHHHHQSYHNPSYHHFGQEYLHSDVALPSYESPVVGHQLVSPQATNPYGQTTLAHSYSGLHSPPDVGLGIQYDAYGNLHTAYYQAEQYGYGVPYISNGSQYGYPLTPQSTDSDVGRNTQSGRSSINRSDGSTILKSEPRVARVTKSPKPRKSKANKSSANTLSLEAPLSVLTKDMTDVPIRDMEAWVNRSVEERLKEVESSKEGHIPRPMNSFMLYRSAYTERTKKYCAQHNHQVVSKMSGASWKLECDDVKNHYERLAKVERDNHSKAHPLYKFSPSKVGAVSNSKKKNNNSSSDDEDEEELIEQGNDFEWRPRGDRRGQVTRQHAPSITAYSPRVDDLEKHFGPNHGNNRSTWEATNEGKPLPAQIGTNEMYRQYYQTSVHSSMSDPHVEDVRIRQVNAPGAFSMPIGIPGSYQEELFTGSEQAQYEPQQVDPSLFPFIDTYNHGNASMDVMDHAMSFDDGGQLYSHGFSSDGAKSQLDQWMEDANNAS